MQLRSFGKDDIIISEVGLGCWQLGADWGDIGSDTAEAVLKASVENGVTFIDTADVYGNGRSEEFIGRFLKKYTGSIFVATKVGRAGSLYPDQYTEIGVRSCIEASLKRLKVDSLDLIQLHCIPGAVMEEGEIFDWLRTLKREGKIKRFGASVESMTEALMCMKQEDLYSLQIIFNIFRQKPIDAVFSKAKEKKVGIIARVPLASGLLTGKFTEQTNFAKNDHRNYNRDGQMFNVGETFAGVPFDKGIGLVEELKTFVPKGMSMAQMALRWILDFDAVSVVIPGASRPEQAEANTRISDKPSLNKALHEEQKTFYEQKVRQDSLL